MLFSPMSTKMYLTKEFIKVACLCKLNFQLIRSNFPSKISFSKKGIQHAKCASKFDFLCSILSFFVSVPTKRDTVTSHLYKFSQIFSMSRDFHFSITLFKVNSTYDLFVSHANILRNLKSRKICV